MSAAAHKRLAAGVGSTGRATDVGQAATAPTRGASRMPRGHASVNVIARDRMEARVLHYSIVRRTPGG